MEYKIPKSVRERQDMIVRLYQAYKEDVPAAGAPRSLQELDSDVIKTR